MRKLFLISVLILSAGALAIYPTLDYWNLIPHPAYSASDFGIVERFSESDADQDGIDDAHDLMLGAREYVESDLKYKSAYYEGGYPNDGYSVCTDVIWNAFFAAGYNLKELVDADIAANTEAYPLDTPDSNIDFRRVRNLKVFFERNAESLTLDLSKLEEWQPGDIIVFSPSHIGILSDKRNQDGIPYLIHHSGQPVKEEDVLIKHKMTIIGHYRWR